MADRPAATPRKPPIRRRSLRPRSLFTDPERPDYKNQGWRPTGRQHPGRRGERLASDHRPARQPGHQRQTRTAPGRGRHSTSRVSQYAIGRERLCERSRGHGHEAGHARLAILAALQREPHARTVAQLEKRTDRPGAAGKCTLGRTDAAPHGDHRPVARPTISDRKPSSRSSESLNQRSASGASFCAVWPKSRSNGI